MYKPKNPHYFNEDQKSLSNISIQSENQKKSEKENQEKQKFTPSKLRLLSIIVNQLFFKRIHSAFLNIKIKPARSVYIKKRLIQVIFATYRKTQYNFKFVTFQKLKKLSVNRETQNVKYMENLLSNMKKSAMKVLCHYYMAKHKKVLSSTFKKIIQYGKEKKFTKNQIYRKGFRKMIRVVHNSMQRNFYKLRDSRFILRRTQKCKVIIKVLKQYRNRSLKAGLQKMRRNIYIKRREVIADQIKQIQNRMSADQDQELEALKQRQYALAHNLQEVQKQKEEIANIYGSQLKEVQSKNQQLIDQIQQLKNSHQKIKAQIQKADEKLRQQYTLDEIFQFFYNNFLLYIHNNKGNTFKKQDLLNALSKPLIPIDIPLDKLIQQNTVLQQLISEYIIIFGEKTLPQNYQLEKPYEYLIKENYALYQVLLSLLPKLSYNRDDFSKMKQTLNSVQAIVKEFI